MILATYLGRMKLYAWSFSYLGLDVLVVVHLVCGSVFPNLS